MANATTAERPTTARGIRTVERTRNRFRRVRENSAGYWFVVPILIVFVVLYLIPMVQSIYYSFTDFNGYVATPKFIGFTNYIRIWADSSMLSALGFTLFYAVATTVLVTALAIPLALILNRRFVGRGFVRSIFFFPAVPSVAILGLVWGFMLNPLGSGAINSIVGYLGMAPIPWLSDQTLAPISVVLVALWTQTGWHAMLYLAYLQSLPSDIFEAAKIDGANRWQEFKSLTLPLLTPAITVSQLLLLTSGLKVYDLPFTLTKGGPGFATRTLTQSIIENGIAQSDIGKASALGVLFLIAVGLIIVAQLALSRRLEERYS